MREDMGNGFQTVTVATSFSSGCTIIVAATRC